MRFNIDSIKIKGFIDLVRPFTLLAPIIVSCCIMFASFFYHGNSSGVFSVFTGLIFPASLSLAFLNGASNALNQYSDLSTDRISKSYRPIPRGDITKNEAIIATVFLYVLSFVLSIQVHPSFMFFVLLITFFTVTYSLYPRFKDKLVFNQLWVAVPRGLLGVLASWSLFGNPFQALPLTIGTIVMVFLLGGCITKDVSDLKADKKTGTMTLVNTYGIRESAFIVFPFLVVPFIMIPIFIDMHWMDGHLWPLSFFVIPAFFVFYFQVNDKIKIKNLENTRAWALMYVTYFFFAFSFSTLTVMYSL